MWQGRSAVETADRQDQAFRGRAWLLVGGQSVATLAEALVLVVVPLAVLDLTNSALQVGVVFMLTQAPALLGFLAGAPRRRFGARHLLIVYNAGRAVLMVAIFCVLAVTSDGIHLAYGLIFAAALFTAFFHPTRIEYIAHIVPERGLARFNSYDRTLEAIAMAVGAGLGGLAYHLLPLPLNFLLAAFAFVLSSLLLLGIGSAVVGTAAAPKVVTTSFRTTLVKMLRRPVTRYLLGGETLTGVAFGVYAALFVIYVRGHLGESPIVYGNLEMILGVAAMLTGFALASGRFHISTRVLVVGGYLGMGLAMVLLAFLTTLPPVYPVIVLLGAANMFYAVGVRTMLQATSPPEERVHVFGVESTLSRSAQIVGGGGGGILLTVTVLQVQWAIGLAGVLVIAAAGWGLWVLFAREPKSIPETEAAVAA
jgi:MFS family permease